MSEIYIYKYIFQNGKKILSAWMLFTVRGSVKSVQFIDSTLYAVVVYNGQILIEKCRLDEGHSDDNGYTTNLDRRIKYYLQSGQTVITLPYIPPTSDIVEVYTFDGELLPSTRVAEVITLDSPIEYQRGVYVGIKYEMRYTFSNQLFKAPTSNGTSPSNASKLMVRNGSLVYNDSTYFKVKVSPKFRTGHESVFTPELSGYGPNNLDSGFFRFPICAEAEDTKISIENDTAQPCTFQSAEFESFVSPRSNRYG